MSLLRVIFAALCIGLFVQSLPHWHLSGVDNTGESEELYKAYLDSIAYRGAYGHRSIQGSVHNLLQLYYIKLAQEALNDLFKSVSNGIISTRPMFERKMENQADVPEHAKSSTIEEAPISKGIQRNSQMVSISDLNGQITSEESLDDQTKAVESHETSKDMIQSRKHLTSEGVQSSTTTESKEAIHEVTSDNLVHSNQPDAVGLTDLTIEVVVDYGSGQETLPEEVFANITHEITELTKREDGNFKIGTTMNSESSHSVFALSESYLNDTNVSEVTPQGEEIEMTSHNNTFEHEIVETKEGLEQSLKLNELTEIGVSELGKQESMLTNSGNIPLMWKAEEKEVKSSEMLDSLLLESETIFKEGTLSSPTTSMFTQPAYIQVISRFCESDDVDSSEEAVIKQEAFAIENKADELLISNNNVDTQDNVVRQMGLTTHSPSMHDSTMKLLETQAIEV